MNHIITFSFFLILSLGAFAKTSVSKKSSITQTSREKYEALSLERALFNMLRNSKKQKIINILSKEATFSFNETNARAYLSYKTDESISCNYKLESFTINDANFGIAAAAYFELSECVYRSPTEVLDITKIFNISFKSSFLSKYAIDYLWYDIWAHAANEISRK
jgi:hypothetical protein